MAYRGSVIRRVAALRQPTMRLLYAAALRCTPTAPLAVLNGAPDTEENALAVALHLSARYNGRVVLLSKSPDDAVGALLRSEAALPLGDASRVEVVRKSSMRATWLYLRAELVFHTHGLFGSPDPGRRRHHVYLGHGAGPKRTTNQESRQKVRSSSAVGNCLIWARCQVEELGMPVGTPLYVGNPRQDAFATPATDDMIREFGIDPSIPFVLWMPTYRRNSTLSAITASDGEAFAVASDTANRSPAAEFAAAVLDSGVQLVIKPHPYDAEDARTLGCLVVDDLAIARSGATLYRLIAAADGVVSDYSSVWTEVLETEISLGLFCPDYEEYDASRGLNVPKAGEVARGLFLDTPRDLGLASK